MLVSLMAHASTVESGASAASWICEPTCTVSIAGLTTKGPGGGGGGGGGGGCGGGGGGGGCCTFGAFESVQAKTPPAAVAAANRSAESVVRVMAEQAAHVPYRISRRG